MTAPQNPRLTQADEEWAEEVASAANIVTNGGYYEIDIDAVTLVIARHREAAEAEAGAREAWQPIETAPKEIEGALYATPRLLLFFPRYGVFTGCWCRDPDYPWGGKWSVPGLLNQEARPTHWMECPLWPEGAHTALTKEPDA